ncbi:MAG: phenylacetic acid degradation-related protein [Crocinitomicaceae bacterium]|jgi:acyl-CoA thioesterase|nr:phenylacetic acid degradation-related protein [Crocinitomicaceae bacterium]
MKAPSEIVQTMMNNDRFSRWLGIEVLEIDKGRCLLKMTVQKDMLNGFDIAHGGISFSLADSALAFASNSYGTKAFSIETSISHLKKVNEGDILLASCTEIYRGKTIGKYKTEVFTQKTGGENQLIAWFQGTVHLSSENW